MTYFWCGLLVLNFVLSLSTVEDFFKADKKWAKYERVCLSGAVYTQQQSKKGAQLFAFLGGVAAGTESAKEKQASLGSLSGAFVFQAARQLRYFYSHIIQDYSKSLKRSRAPPVYS